MWERMKTLAMVSLPFWVYVGVKSQSSDENLKMDSPSSSSGSHGASASASETMAALQLIKDSSAEFYNNMAAKMEREQIDSTEARHEEPVYRLVLTGGPCGGKSTAMSHIMDRLTALGFRVFCVPEAASLLITGVGMVPPMLPEHERITFEGTLLRTKIALEDTFTALAKASKRRSVVLCDRGTMDTRAYMDKETFDLVLSEFGWNVVDLRDRRYDGVIHLVTAAIGAPAHYGTENNAARHESLEEAAELDFKILEAWVGHPRIRIVDNSTDWKGKLARVLDIVCQFVGAPRPTAEQRKFVLENFNEADLQAKGIRVETFDVEQTYLHKPHDLNIKGYTYLRRRGQNGCYTYTLSSTGQPRVLPSDVAATAGALSFVDEKSIILDRAITGREYIALLRQMDSRRLTVKKKVHCFVHDNHYYEIHKFSEPNIGLVIANTEAEQAQLPPFLTSPAEVTGRKEFSSYFISKHFQRKERRNRDWRQDPLYSAHAPFTHQPSSDQASL
jgi:predicted ATPase